MSRSTILLLLALVSLPLQAREFAVAARPAWTDFVDVPANVAVAKQNVRWGIYDVLSDHQLREGAEYFRIVRKVLSPRGVQNASELSLDFDPSFQRLVLHDISILRRGERIDALEPDAIRVIDKEDDAAQRIYDGERTALIFLKDVRPDDVIDYSWSIEGTNPILGGRFTEELDLSSGVPSRLIRHRLLWPAHRNIRWIGDNPRSTRTGDTYELVWEARDVEALDVEDEIPRWYQPWRSVQLSEFTSWHEVALWADAMFQLDERSQAEVQALAERLRGEHATRDAQLTAAIRFVQDDIRYLGIEMGRNSHEPHQPWETLETRWGDCKDKTLLLVALLRELGAEAYPALVSTRMQHRIAQKLPSPFVFDHVIAQVIEGGRTYWIDGTISDQGGTLTTIETPSDRRALIVRPETRSLATVVTNQRGATDVLQTYTVRSYGEATELEVRTTYSGGDADAMRGELATLSLEDYADRRINELAADQPKIAAAGPPRVADDRLRNVLVVTEKYRIQDLWKDGSWTWYPRALDAHLTRPSTMIRKMPLAFPYPLDVRQTVRFHLPEELEVEKVSSLTETETFRYDYRVDANGKSVTIRHSLRALRDAVAAEDVPEHLTKISSIWSENGYRIVPAAAQRTRTAAASAMLPNVKWGLGLFVLAMFVGLCWMLALRERTPKRAVAKARPAFLPGESPASALALSRAEDIDNHLAGLACTCGAAAYSLPDRQRARYDGRELTIVTRHCAACGREQSVYFI